MEQRDSHSAPGFWPVLAAVFIAGWIGGLVAALLWSLIGGYAVVDVLRGFKPTAGRPSLIETFVLTLVGQTIVRAVVGAFVLPPVLKAICGAVVGRLTAGFALLAGGFVSATAWFAFARSGASSRRCSRCSSPRSASSSASGSCAPRSLLMRCVGGWSPRAARLSPCCSAFPPSS